MHLSNPKKETEQTLYRSLLLHSQQRVRKKCRKNLRSEHISHMRFLAHVIQIIMRVCPRVACKTGEKSLAESTKNFFSFFIIHIQQETAQ